MRHIRGRVIISHVRLATSGGFSASNTHPWEFRGWAFAHNGGVDRAAVLSLLKGRYAEEFEGDTDSEAFFRLVVQEVEDVGDPVDGIKSAIDKIVSTGARFTSLNSLLSDGEVLYALRYAASSLNYYTLYYVARPAEEMPLESVSRETRQLIMTKLARGERAVLVASEPMSDEPTWEPVPNRHLLVIRGDLGTEVVPIH